MVSKEVYGIAMIATGSRPLAAVMAMLFLELIARLCHCVVIQLVWPFPYGQAAEFIGSKLFGKMVDRLIESFEVSVHAPMANLGAANSAQRSANLAEILKSIRYGMAHGIILHTLHLADMDRKGSGILQNEKPTVISKDDSFVGFKKIIEELNESDFVIGLENLSQPAFHRIESFKHLFGDKIGLTLDVAHAVSQGLDPVKIIIENQEHLRIVHLTTTKLAANQINKKVKHCAYDAQGAYDLTPVLDTLLAIGFKGPVIMEVNLWDFLRSWRWLAKRGYV